MSVDYYSCDCCGEAVYEEYVHSCPKCGRSICDDCLNEDVDTPQRIDSKEDLTEEQYKYLCDKYGEELINKEVISWGEINPEYCPFCSGAEIDTDDLLNYILDKHLNMSLEEITKEYREYKQMIKE